MIKNYVILMILLGFGFYSVNVYAPTIYDVNWNTTHMENSKFMLEMSWKTDVPSYTGVFVFSEHYRERYALTNDSIFNWWFEDRIVCPCEYTPIFKNMTFNNIEGNYFSILVKWLNEEDLIYPYYRYFEGSYYFEGAKRNHHVDIMLDGRIRYYVVLTASASDCLECMPLTDIIIKDACSKEKECDINLGECLILLDGAEEFSLPIRAMYSTRVTNCQKLSNYNVEKIAVNYEEEYEEYVQDEGDKTISQIITSIVTIIIFIGILIYIARYIKRRKK